MVQHAVASNVKRIAHLDMPGGVLQFGEVDDCGLIYPLDRNNGFDILEYEG